MNKDKREVKILFLKNGMGSRATKINIPLPWIDHMGITENDREVIIEKVGKKIIITKKKSEK